MILAIDQGTTGTTCLVFDREGRIAGRAYSEFEQHFPRPGWVEHDATEIWEVTRGVAAEAIADAGIEGASLEGIGITNQRETVVAWDPAIRGAGPQRPRLAGPPDGGALRRASRGRSRGPRAGADGPRHRPVLLGHEDRVALAKRRGSPKRRLRDDRLLAHLQAHGPPRHRLLERVADDALRHPQACLGRGALCPSRCRSRLAAGAGSVRRRLRNHPGVRRRGARGRHRGGPAGRPVRTALRSAGAGEEHVRDRAASSC